MWHRAHFIYHSFGPGGGACSFGYFGQPVAGMASSVHSFMRGRGGKFETTSEESSVTRRSRFGTW